MQKIATPRDSFRAMSDLRKILARPRVDPVEEEPADGYGLAPPPAVWGALSTSAGGGAGGGGKSAPDPDGDAATLAAYETTALAAFPVQHTYLGRFQTFYAPPSPLAPVLVCHHGVGSSAMSFAMLSLAVRREANAPGVFAFDMRGHGASAAASDYSLAALTADFAAVLAEFCRLHPSHALYLVGHSLGGAVLTNFLSTRPRSDIHGLVMLDIVEETAVRSLAAMPLFISKRPPTFNSYQSAIDWHTGATHLLHNERSAAVSVPALLRRLGDTLEWITNLALTQPYWPSWFAGLLGKFVAALASKLLILAGHETLDTSLIIGQMQGKYQLVVFNNSPTGHFVHEDIPDQVALTLADLIRRTEAPEEYMRQELGVVPKWGGKINP